MTTLLERPAEAIPARWQDEDEFRWAARHWASRIGVKLRGVYLRPMSRKWASVSVAGRLTLDTSLLDLPRELGEFVIVHELVHLLCPDAKHGRVFKSFLNAYLPDWGERLGRLDEITRSQPRIGLKARRRVKQ